MKVCRNSLSLLFFVILFACDTKSDFESDFKKYYLKYYGEDGDQYAVDFVVNNDGTVLLLGNTEVPADGSRKIMLTKVDPEGNVLWSRKYGSGLDTQGRSVQENAQDIEELVNGSGEFYILSNMFRGTEVSTNENLYDFKIIHIRPDGSVIDSMEFGNNGTWNTQFIRSVTPTMNGGFVVTGNSTNESILTDPGMPPNPPDQEDVFTIGFDDQYNQIWSTAPASQGEHYGSGIKAFEVIESRIGFPPDTLYYTFYYSDRQRRGTYESNFWPFKISTRGATLLEGTPAGATNYNELLSFVCKVPPELGGGFYEIGTQVEGTASSGSLYFCQRNIDLTINEEGRISIPGDLTAISAAPSRKSSGFLILADEIVPTGTIIKLLKVDHKGNFLWSMPFGSTGQDGNSGARVEELPDGTILVFCTIELETQNKMALMRLNSKGEFLN